MKEWTYNPVRLGQVRITINCSKMGPQLSPIHLLACFGQKFEGNCFEESAKTHTIRMIIRLFLFLLG
jgi:hypothetical protein